SMFTQLITAYGAKEFDKFLAYMREDTVFEWPFRPLADFPEQITGGSTFVEISKEGMADCLPYNHQVDQFYDLVEPDTLIVEYHTDTTYLPTNERYANNYISIVRFEDDKVVYWKEYINPLPVLEVYGSDFSNETAASATPDEK
ncbi:MAG: nuclear transport factor 2 family protein, partial [Gammaproteobacteria bacterium]|nr:nuclear transport factor 2 family protein [Gammaproteobacteria bacterium]